MDSKFHSCATLEIHEALLIDHKILSDGLLRAAAELGRIGEMAGRVAQVCLPHFAEEEKGVFRAIRLLNDSDSDRVRSDMEPATQMIAQLSAQHLAIRGHRQAINATIEALLHEASKQENKAICDLVHFLRDHEYMENQLMYPALQFAGEAVRRRLGH